MKKTKIEDIVYQLSDPIVLENGFEIVDIEYKKEGPNWYLRIYLDKEGGITIDDCQIFSKQISQKIDEIDPIEHSYILEVSSPGVDRPLKKEKDFIKYINHKIIIKLYKSINKRKSFVGILKDFKDDQVVIEIENDEKLVIALTDIGSAKLFFEF